MPIHKVQGEAGNTGTKGRAASEFAVYSVKVKMNTETARVYLPNKAGSEISYVARGQKATPVNLKYFILII